jgi:hypothetical protein
MDVPRAACRSHDSRGRGRPREATPFRAAMVGSVPGRPPRRVAPRGQLIGARVIERDRGGHRRELSAGRPAAGPRCAVSARPASGHRRYSLPTGTRRPVKSLQRPQGARLGTSADAKTATTAGGCPVRLGREAWLRKPAYVSIALPATIDRATEQAASQVGRILHADRRTTVRGDHP